MSSYVKSVDKNFTQIQEEQSKILQDVLQSLNNVEKEFDQIEEKINSQINDIQAIDVND